MIVEHGESELRRLSAAHWVRAPPMSSTEMIRRSVASGAAARRMSSRRASSGWATVSTVAVARWMAGEGETVARDVGQESWRIFAQLAAQRAAPFNEVTKRCLRWRDSTAEVLNSCASELELEAGVLDEALKMLQRSLEVTLVRMCESFEDERQRSARGADPRQKELAFLATHDALTGLPNRTLILDRIEQMLTRARLNQAPVAALFVDLDNFKAHQRLARPRRRRRAAAGGRRAARRRRCARPMRSAVSAATSSS